MRKLGTYERGVQRNILVTLTQNQFDALVALNYNTFAINNPNNDIVQLINSGANASNIKSAWLNWNKVRNPSTGKHEFNQGVYNRRQDEFEVYESADYIRTHFGKSHP